MRRPKKKIIRKTCERCLQLVRQEMYLKKGNQPNACKECWTMDELHEYIRPPLTVAMLGVPVKSKCKIIKQMIKAYQRQRDLR